MLICNADIVSDGQCRRGNVFIEGGDIVRIDYNSEINRTDNNSETIDATGLLLLPGVIDEHVHFREPGLTHKGDIYSESRAAAAGGVTTFMDMPNTIPQTTTIEQLKIKQEIAAENSIINYLFYLGVTNDNLKEVAQAAQAGACGIKLFMGSSTGNMLVNDELTLNRLFATATLPIAVHAEDETIIRNNAIHYKELYDTRALASLHPLIRSREACYRSTAKVVELAHHYRTRLHILHLSTTDELQLLDNTPIEDKYITAEACIEHLWYDDTAYSKLNNLMKVNPAVKCVADRESLLKAVRDGYIDTIATDHAPHTIEEKTLPYFDAPSGVPVIQHSLVAMLELWHKGVFSIETIVQKMCHNPATIYNIEKRGFIREGYKADICLINPNKQWIVSKENILHKSGWSAFPEGTIFNSKVVKTIVDGKIIYSE